MRTDEAVPPAHLFEVFGAGGIAREEPLKLPQRPRKRQPRVLIDVHENQRGRFHTRSPLSGNRVQGIAPIASGFRPYSQTNTTPGGCMRQPDKHASIIEAVSEANQKRKNRMAQKVIAACGGSIVDKSVAILGLAFKQNTDDIREAPSIDIVTTLQAAGAKVRAYDPQAMEQARQVLSDVTFCQNAYLCAEGASALVIVTEWDAFRALDLARVKDALSEPVIVDLRNIYSPSDMRQRGFHYFSVGRQ